MVVVTTQSISIVIIFCVFYINLYRYIYLPIVGCYVLHYYLCTWCQARHCNSSYSLTFTIFSPLVECKRIDVSIFCCEFCGNCTNNVTAKSFHFSNTYKMKEKMRKKNFFDTIIFLKLIFIMHGGAQMNSIDW